uniref:Putative ovule protein n=1 Tax=Solanum chacoense TaxID=4108 RepID=A0A0V0GMH8_SOLCH
MFRGPKFRRNCGYHRENNVGDEVEVDTIPLKQVSHKEAIITSRTLHYFLIQVKKTIPELLDEIRKIRYEL